MLYSAAGVILPETPTAPPIKTIRFIDDHMFRHYVFLKSIKFDYAGLEYSMDIQYRFAQNVHAWLDAQTGLNGSRHSAALALGGS